MILEVEKQKENVEIYEIDNKKYTVITRTMENCENIEGLYNIICKFVVSKLN